MRILRANVIRARASLTQLIGRIDARSRHSVKNFHFALATQGESIDDLLWLSAVPRNTLKPVRSCKNRDFGRELPDLQCGANKLHKVTGDQQHGCLICGFELRARLPYPILVIPSKDSLCILRPRKDHLTRIW